MRAHLVDPALISLDLRASSEEYADIGVLLVALIGSLVAAVDLFENLLVGVIRGQRGIVERAVQLTDGITHERTLP